MKQVARIVLSGAVTVFTACGESTPSDREVLEIIRAVHGYPRFVSIEIGTVRRDSPIGGEIARFVRSGDLVLTECYPGGCYLPTDRTRDLFQTVNWNPYYGWNIVRPFAYTIDISRITDKRASGGSADIIYEVSLAPTEYLRHLSQLDSAHIAENTSLVPLSATRVAQFQRWESGWRIVQPDTQWTPANVVMSLGHKVTTEKLRLALSVSGNIDRSESREPANQLEEVSEPKDIRIQARGREYTIAFTPNPPRATARTSVSVYARNPQTGEIVYGADGIIAGTHASGANVDGRLDRGDGPALFSNLLFAAAGDWAMMLQFRTSQNEQFDRVDWIQTVLPIDRVPPGAQASRNDSIAARCRAASIRRDLLRGLRTFEQVAQVESSDSASVSAGGSLGRGPRGRFVDAFERAAFALEVREVSQPILTEFGYHLIRVDARLADTIDVRHIQIPVKRGSAPRGVRGLFARAMCRVRD